MTDAQEPLDRLRRDLKLRTLSGWWAKAEIVLGLVGVAAGLFSLLDAAVVATRLERPAQPGLPVDSAGPGVILIVLGGYLTLAGHRSHLYQSNNRLAAYLADLIRPQQKPGTNP